MTRAYKPEIIDKERKALELRRAGVAYDVIAQNLGYTGASGAWTAVQRALKRTLREAGAEQVRDQELDRLDRMQQAVWGRALQGDLPAVGTVLRIMERRAKMLGLDAPVTANIQVEHLDGNSIDAEVQRLIAALADNTPVKQLPTPIIDAEIIEDESTNNLS
jgi:hypothetical protein